MCVEGRNYVSYKKIEDPPPPWKIMSFRQHLQISIKLEINPVLNITGGGGKGGGGLAPPSSPISTQVYICISVTVSPPLTIDLLSPQHNLMLLRFFYIFCL